ncbi:MAG: hypothetical protein KJZ78_01930 [Bryobacteraceae bacterium]|nr:hypothetical protein [Bryobacteraceae bacterium]
MRSSKVLSINASVLLTLPERNTDNAAVTIEQLDDVELKTNGQTLLYQTKHSRSVWRTVEGLDRCPARFSAVETTFHLDY